MIGGLHWTLWALVELCFGCLLLNFIQWRAVGAVRLSGIIVCATWAVQQAWWASTGLNSLALAIACDSLILLFFLSRRGANNASDWLIFALTPATMMIYIPEYLGEQTVQGWWINWSVVVAQMILGMPRGSRQRIPLEVTHGPLRKVGGDVSFARSRA